MDRFAGGLSLIPEQDWDSPNLAPSPPGTPPETASIGFVNGEPAGSANPLSWSAASFVRLMPTSARAASRDRPQRTYQRYVARTQGTTPLTVTSPADQSAVTGSPVTVTGTTSAGERRLRDGHEHGRELRHDERVDDGDAERRFQRPVAVTGGTTVLTSSPSARAAARRT